MNNENTTTQCRKKEKHHTQCRNKEKTPQHIVGIKKNTTKQCKNKEKHHKTIPRLSCGVFVFILTLFCGVFVFRTDNALCM
jgi:hypothetical protein